MLARSSGSIRSPRCSRTRRELLFRRFVELWQAEASKGTWAALERAL